MSKKEHCLFTTTQFTQNRTIHPRKFINLHVSILTNQFALKKNEKMKNFLKKMKKEQNYDVEVGSLYFMIKMLSKNLKSVKRGRDTKCS
jgi:hypothetical protein